MLSNAADRRVELRRSQFRRSEDDDFRLAAARAIVAGKLANSRLLLRRYYRFRPGGQSPVDGRLRDLQSQVWRAERIETPRGLERDAAAVGWISAAHPPGNLFSVVNIGS